MFDKYVVRMFLFLCVFLKLLFSNKLQLMLYTEQMIRDNCYLWWLFNVLTARRAGAGGGRGGAELRQGPGQPPVACWHLLLASLSSEPSKAPGSLILCFYVSTFTAIFCVCLSLPSKWDRVRLSSVILALTNVLVQCCIKILCRDF